MQIQLKQTAIEAALSDYILKQGINLKGRAVSMAFTASRKGGGLTVDVDISDVADIPGYGAGDPEPATTSGSGYISGFGLEAPEGVISSQPRIIEAKKVSIATDTPRVAPVASPAFDPDPTPEPEPEVVEAKPIKVKADPKVYDLQPEDEERVVEPVIAEAVEVTKPVSLFA